MTDTLVLAHTYEPIAVEPWQQAVTRIYEGEVEVVSYYDDWVVHSANDSWQVPEIIRWTRQVPTRRKGIRFSRDAIYRRDGGRCQYCGKHVPKQLYQYDHVTPRTQGGGTTWTNIVVSCLKCNQYKGGRTPRQAGMRLLSTPQKPLRALDMDPLPLHWNPSMPLSWKDWLRSELYWNVELENDESK